MCNLPNCPHEETNSDGVAVVDPVLDALGGATDTVHGGITFVDSTLNNLTPEDIKASSPSFGEVSKLVGSVSKHVPIAGNAIDVIDITVHISNGDIFALSYAL